MADGVMTKFKITELSGVDDPAQKGARVAIIKRDSPPPVGPPAGMTVDWGATKASMESYLDQHAKARVTTSGQSYAKAYSAVLAEAPAAVQSIVLGR